MTGMNDAVVTGITIEGSKGERLVLAAVEDEENLGHYHYGLFMLDMVGNVERVGSLLSKEAYVRVYEFFEPMSSEPDEYTDEEM